MQQEDDIDLLLKTGGCYAPQVDQNDSLDNNIDKLSERRNDLNIMDDNYEGKWMQVNDLNISKDISKVEDKHNEYDKDSIEYRLLNSDSFEDYDDALTQYIMNMGIYAVNRLGNIMKIILEERKNVNFEMMEISRNCIFLKQLSSKFKEIENIEIYREAIAEILKSSRYFYTYNFNEQSIQILNIYLQQQNPDFTSVYQFISEFFQNEMKLSLTSIQTHFYRYIHSIFINSCFRQGKQAFNLFLISRADGVDQEQYMKEHQSCLLIREYSQLDRKDLEEYLQLLLEVCKASEQFIEKYLLATVQWLLEESEQMDKKLLGFRIINDLILEVKNRQRYKYLLVNWLIDNKIVEIFLRDSTHSRILQQMQPIIHFLYESGVLADIQIIELMKSSLHSEEIFKVVQSMLGWLKLQHLFLVFQIIPYHTDRQSTLYINFISSLLANPLISDDNSRRRKTFIIQDNRREVEGEVEMDGEDYPESTKQFVKKLMHLLIELVVQCQNNYMPIILKLITAHSRLFKDQLEIQIIKLLRNNSVCSLWIIEHWLKIQTARDRGQGKYELITKLASEGVFELMLALLARHRFSRPVVEKALSVIIIFCRFNRPLEKNIAEFLWKVLGNTGRDERQRQQFFVFLKELVRYEGSVTEQSVNFIFFDILISMVADWFSLRVYDCLQMLFLRLNQDCKLISFERDHYKIVKQPLIGTDKFIYIYFNCMDLKVVKKCKEFICKLIANSEQAKEAMHLYIIGSIKKYMTYAIQMVKPEQFNKRQIIILRVFDIAEKLSLEKEKVEEAKENTINLHIQVSNMYILGARNSNMEFNERISLSDLRCYIGDNLNPPTKNIELWTKGKLLKGENLNLKELKLQSNQTISVTKAEDMEIQEDKNQKKKQQLQLLTSIAGDQADPQFLKYVVNKFEGETIETIANNLFDPDRLRALEQEFKQKKFEKEEVIIEVENSKQKSKNFGTLLVHQRDIFEMLLECLKISQNKSGGWSFIKKLPLNEAYVLQVNSYIQSGKWQRLFHKNIVEHALYIIHIISNHLKQCPDQRKALFEEKGLRVYLITWLSQIVETTPELLSNYEDLLKLFLVETQCPIITLLDSFLQNKAISEKDYQIITMYGQSIQRGKQSHFEFEPQSTARMIDCLLNYNISDRLASLIIKIYILQIIYPIDRSRYYSILGHQKLSLLLLKYGKPIEFIIIASTLHLNSETNKNFLHKFTFELLSTFRQEHPHDKQQKYSYCSFFSCLNELLSMSPVVDSLEELNILTQILYEIKNKIGQLQEDQIIGFFNLSLTLLDRHFKSDHGGERKNEDMHFFANWLFNQYLFGKNNSYPYFTSKLLRKTAYQLLIKMCGYHAILKLIAQSIRNLMKSFKDSNSNEVEGEIRNSQFIGMKNLGATCYINSLIQQLYHTAFPGLLLEEDNEPSDSPIKLLQLKRIFASLHTGIRSPVYPNEFVETVKITGQFVRPMVQQDVNEFFASLMHDVEQAVGSRTLNQTICGTLCHQIRGLEEGSEVKSVDETFLTLMIDIKYKKNLLQALSSLSKAHFLEGQNMYYSEVLHKKIRASSKTYLGKLPNILVITLKRFYWNFEQMNRIKINDYFQFPLELDLTRFAMQGRKEHDSHYFQYKLCGIIIHSGSAESGHYYSFIKVGEKWLEFNDRKVTEWDIHNNLKSECFGGNDEKSKNAYMLFYERVDSQAHGSSLNKLPQTNKMLQLIKQENQNFVLNRLIYDSNYIDFIKELSKFEHYNSILSVLDSLKYYRQTSEVYFEKPDIMAQEDKLLDLKEKAVGFQGIHEEREVKKQFNHVTQEEVNQLVTRYYPIHHNLKEILADQAETNQLKYLNDDL